MNTRRTAAHAPRTEALGTELMKLRGPCIGCTDCEGVCEALIDTLCLPNVILRTRAT